MINLHPLVSASNPCRRIVVLWSLLSLFLLVSVAQGRELPGLGAEPIRLDSRHPVLVWEDENIKVFVAPRTAEVRQGQMRIVAPQMVLWLDKGRSRTVTQVRVYAQGRGRPGRAAIEPVHLVRGERVEERGVVYRHLSSQVGLAWDCPVKQVESQADLGSLYGVATAVTEGRRDFVQEELPGRQRGAAPPSIRQILQADEIHFFTDEETGVTTGVYMGNVRGSYRNVQLTSDVAVLWVKERAESYEFYARGDVRLQRTGEGRVAGGMLGMGEFKDFRADEVYVNPDRERGRSTETELRMQMPQGGPDDIVVVRGRDVYILDSKNLAIEEVSATHCTFGDPHYELTARRARLVREDPHLFLSTWDVGVETGRNEEPLFKLPFLSVDLGEDPGYVLRSVAVGSSDKFGGFVRTRWRPRHLGLDADWIRGWDVRLDYFGDRGPGIGNELEYGFGGPEEEKHMGFLRAYYINDSGDEDDTGVPVPKQSRGRGWWQHRSRWSERWRTDAEFYWLSDVGFLEEYFEEDFENLRPPETYVFTRYRGDQTWAALTIKMQVNDFMTQLEERPGLELEGIGMPLGPAVYDASFEAGQYDLNISDELAMSDPPSLWRAHTEHRLSLPFSIGAMHFDPFVRALGTWAEEGMGPGGSTSGSESRVGLGGGLRTSLDFMRTYGADAPAVGINRLRHILTPYLEVEALGVNTGSEEFIQLGSRDPWPRRGHGQRVPTDRVDAIDDMSEVRLGLRQRFQTKRRDNPGDPWQSIDWIDLDVAYVGRSDDSVRGREDDYVDIDFVWNLLSWLKFYSEDNRISVDEGTDVVNLGASVQLTPQTGMGLAYHYISDSSSTLTGNLRLRLSDRYSLSVYEQYELDSRGMGGTVNLETRVALERAFHQWLGRLIFYYDAGNDGDIGLMVGFTPRGLLEFTPVGFGTFEE